MIAKYFRFIGENGKPTGWYGFVYAKDMSEAFNLIDEFGDPCRVEFLKKNNPFSFCFKAEEIPSLEGNECDMIEYSDFEVCEYMFDATDEKAKFKNVGKEMESASYLNRLHENP